MIKIVRTVLITLLLFNCILLACSCGASCRVQMLDKQGKLPTSRDFPNTKWVCQEMDMYFYMLDSDVSDLIGEFVYCGKSYRLTVGLMYDWVSLGLYETTEISSEYVFNDNGSNFLKAERKLVDSADGQYIYENETLCFYGLKCVLDGGLNAFPETLKFKQEGMIAKNPEKKWYNDELDMYIESFSDAENYFRGEIVIDNKRVSLFGYEIGNNYLYAFESEQGELVWLWLEFSNDGKIIARACADSYYIQFFDDWSYKGESIVFLPV